MCVIAVCVPVGLCAYASARRLLCVVQEQGPAYRELCECSTEWVVFSVHGASDSRFIFELRTVVKCVVLCYQCSLYVKNRGPREIIHPTVPAQAHLRVAIFINEHIHTCTIS